MSNIESATGRGDLAANSNGRHSLAELVLDAADVSPMTRAFPDAGLDVSFGELAARTREAADVLCGSRFVDDSSLVVALMMSTPGLADGGTARLGEVLAPLRSAAGGTLTTVN